MKTIYTCINLTNLVLYVHRSWFSCSFRVYWRLCLYKHSMVGTPVMEGVTEEVVVMEEVVMDILTIQETITDGIKEELLFPNF